MEKYWAHLDNNRIVTQVVVATEEYIASGRLGLPQNWVETSPTGEFRKHFAGIGYTYDLTLNAFISPKPFPSWVLNQSTCSWEAPIPYPEDGKYYVWDENTLSWVEFNY
jgi:hypothetical protein